MSLKEKKYYTQDGREIKHFDPVDCDICFLLSCILVFSQGKYPEKDWKERIFKIHRDHVSKENDST